MFKFFGVFLHKLSEVTAVEDMKMLSHYFPNNLKHARRLQAIKHDDFEKLVVCHKCHSTYEYEDCTNCTFIRFLKSVCEYRLHLANLNTFSAIKVCLTQLKHLFNSLEF